MSACPLPSVYETDLLANVFDALPVPALVVDADAHILDFNFAAAALLERVPFAVLRPSLGESLQCIHSTESPGGCGQSTACQECEVRNSIKDVFEGARTTRKVANLAVLRDGWQTSLLFLVTVAPVPDESEPLALVILDDAAELTALLNPASSSPDSKGHATGPGRKTGSS